MEHDYEAALTQAESDLDEIDRALERVNDATYGVCTHCGEPISADRLAAKPTTTVCELHSDQD